MNTKKQGFTLIEVVVAISILSLIVFATVTSMRTLALSQEKLEDRAAQISRLLSVSQYLRQALATAEAITLFEFGAPKGVYFLGESDSVEWATPISMPSNQHGIWSLHLSEVDGQLVLKMRPGIAGGSWSDDTLEHVLLEQVDSIVLKYRESGYSPWVETWGEVEGANQLPTHISLKIKSGGRFWPEIIVPTVTVDF